MVDGQDDKNGGKWRDRQASKKSDSVKRSFVLIVIGSYISL